MIQTKLKMTNRTKKRLLHQLPFLNNHLFRNKESKRVSLIIVSSFPRSLNSRKLLTLKAWLQILRRLTRIKKTQTPAKIEKQLRDQLSISKSAST